MERELEQVKSEKAFLMKKHMQEMENRDCKEVRIVCVVSVCVLVFACISMITRIMV